MSNRIVMRTALLAFTVLTGVGLGHAGGAAELPNIGATCHSLLGSGTSSAGPVFVDHCLGARAPGSGAPAPDQPWSCGTNAPTEGHVVIWDGTDPTEGGHVCIVVDVSSMAVSVDRVVTVRLAP